MNTQGRVNEEAFVDSDFFSESEEEYEIDFDEYVAAEGLTELHAAIMSHETVKAKHLIKTGSDINTPNKKKQTPIFTACSHRKNGTDLVKNLFESGAKIDVVDANGQTPLHMAVAADNYENVKFLIEKGSDILARDKFQHDPLSFASMLNISPKLHNYLIKNTTVQLRKRIATIKDQQYQKILLTYLNMIHKNYHENPKTYTTLVSQLRLVIDDIPTLLEKQNFDEATKRTNQFYKNSSSILETNTHLRVLGIVAITLLCIILGGMCGFALSGSAIASNAVLSSISGVSIAGFPATKLCFELLAGTLFALAGYAISHACFFAAEKNALSIHEHSLDEIKQKKDALRYR